jgi:hypothetical protein
MRSLTFSGWAVVVAVALTVAAATWIGLQVGAHLWQDHQDHHLVIELLKYNVQQGHLVPLPSPSGPAPAPAPPPKP